MARAKGSEPMPEFTGTVGLAQALGVNPATINKWTHEGHLKQATPGKYAVTESIHAWARMQYGVGESPRRSIEEEKANKLKRENRLAERELFEAKDVHEVIFEMGAVFNHGIEHIASRIAVRGEMKPMGELLEIAREEASRIVSDFIDAGQEIIMDASPSTDQNSAHPLPGRLGSGDAHSSDGISGAGAIPPGTHPIHDPDSASDDRPQD